MNTADAQGGTIAVDAPAKINLALHICGRRPDGYHLLDSLVVFTNVGDRVTVSESDKLRLSVTGPFGDALKDEPDNLVLRAARFLRTAANIEVGAHIVLEKNLPVASGIGGGSADAAATLHACAKLWGVDLSKLANTELASKLGADIPVCVFKQPAFMSGIGEVISPAPALPECWLVLVNPGQPLATKKVFGALTEFSAPLRRDAIEDLSNADDLARILKEHKNDLAKPAAGLVPAIETAIAALEDTSGCLLARLSGSGPTCFGVFAEEQAARDAAAQISSNEPQWWIAPTQVLPP